MFKSYCKKAIEDQSLGFVILPTSSHKFLVGEKRRIASKYSPPSPYIPPGTANNFRKVMLILWLKASIPKTKTKLPTVADGKLEVSKIL